MSLNFVKIFDEAAALKLEELGYSYTTEKINKKQKLYCFEATPEFLTVLEDKFKEVKENGAFISEGKMRF